MSDQSPGSAGITDAVTQSNVKVLGGVSGPVSITIDKWGIPHIKAETPADAFFAQGWNAARDRLWQIDLWRKRGLGLLAGDFGPAYARRMRPPACSPIADR